jgi:hypothetical protein
MGLKDDWATVAEGGGREPEEGLEPSSGMRSALPILDDAARSPDPAVCPFFRREVDGKLFAPLLEPDDDNRCGAIGAPRPQSARQQELVCLQSAHADCPRYLRGAMSLATPPARRRPPVPGATLAALLVLVLSAGISFGFVVQRGGIDLPLVATSGSPTAAAFVASPTPVATAAVTPVPTLPPTPSASATPVATPSPVSTASPTPAPTATPTPARTATPVPSATSDRYAVLTPCPDRAGCYIYTVRVGDNLFSIAHWFGIPLDTIYAWNPQYSTNVGLRAGQLIRMPPPTR